VAISILLLIVCAVLSVMNNLIVAVYKMVHGGSVWCGYRAYRLDKVHEVCYVCAFLII
jgi:hypothetical protein